MRPAYSPSTVHKDEPLRQLRSSNPLLLKFIVRSQSLVFIEFFGNFS